MILGQLCGPFLWWYSLGPMMMRSVFIIIICASLPFGFRVWWSSLPARSGIAGAIVDRALSCPPSHYRRFFPRATWTELDTSSWFPDSGGTRISPSSSIAGEWAMSDGWSHEANRTRQARGNVWGPLHGGISHRVLARSRRSRLLFKCVIACRLLAKPRRAMRGRHPMISECV